MSRVAEDAAGGVPVIEPCRAAGAMALLAVLGQGSGGAEPRPTGR